MNKMDLVFYLFNLALSNYVDNVENPIFETILISFISKNMNLVISKDSIYYFINRFHFEMDNLYHRYPRSDIKFAVNNFFQEDSNLSYNHITNNNIKRLSKKIYEIFLFSKK